MKAILINIFGGIVRCDRVAEGVVEAYKTIGQIDIPVIVRLQGTNAEEAKVLIDNSGLEVHSAITLEEAAGKVKELVTLDQFLLFREISICFCKLEACSAAASSNLLVPSA